MSNSPTVSILSSLDALCERAAEKVLFRWWPDGEHEAEALGAATLRERAFRAAAAIQDRVRAGDRVLLLFPQGLEFLYAWLGCLACRAIAVPGPALERDIPERWSARIQSIVADARPALILGTRGVRSAMARIEGIADVPWLDIEEALTAPPDAARVAVCHPDDLAWLQYTSGSTSAGKGVMVTHGRALANTEYIRRHWGFDRDARNVVWVPNYHDDCLVHGLLQTIHTGLETVLLPPPRVSGRPFLWLSAISRHRATHAGGPNFIYELSLRKVRDEELEALDLSAWKNAYNAAETIRLQTLDRFADRFARAGFSRDAFRPAYGLAEATLLVTIRHRSEPLRALALDPAALEEGRVTKSAGPHATIIVSCGRTGAGTEVRIVDPATSRPTEGVGEIWVRGPAVSTGYWGRPDDTSMAARIAPGGEGPFLRTGDLGFLHEGDLFVTGRLKDLVIIAGKNHYPQDIEWSVEASHESLRRGCSAAFAIDDGTEERLVLVMEVDTRGDAEPRFEEISRAARRATALHHGLSLSSLWLLPPMTIPKTPSGKVQRGATRAAYLAGALPALARFQWQPPKDAGPERRPQELLGWLRERVAALSGCPIDEVDLDLPVATLGLSSIDVAGLADALSERLGRPVPLTLLWANPSVRALDDALSAPAGTTSAFAPPKPVSEPVAIVGIACRVPGADDLASFWAALCEGRDSVGPVPPERWDVRALEAALGAEARVLCRGGFLRDFAGFDANFFHVTAAEARRMDPQQRLLLELTWEALEDAGVPPEAIAGTDTAVFTGICSSDYMVEQFLGGHDVDGWVPTGTSYAVAANRISYFFDLRGPSLAIDTACSSSLVAVHEACQALRAGRCTLAIAAGVNLVLRPQQTLALARAGMISATGTCRAFDAQADGFVRGEGAAVLVLKPLSRALADGDRIYAVVRGSAVNQDGRSNGLTSPSGTAHEAVVRAACRDAGITPGQIGYVEAQGTGSPVGDMIEAAALGAALSEGRDGEPCLLGSVKTNIGHLEAAGGIVGLIKAALAVRTGRVPPSLHFERPNPHIPFDRLRLKVATRAVEWTSDERFAGVHAFGFGGTNAHVVIASPPSPAPVPAAVGGPLLLVASAADPKALAARVGQLRAALDRQGALDVCLAASRLGHLPFRVAVAAGTPDELKRRLSVPPSPRRAEAIRPAFVFSGVEGAGEAMGRVLAARWPAFAASVAQCRTSLPAAALEATAVELFCWQVGVVELLRGLGVEPAGAFGRGAGAVTAAWARGELDLAGAARKLAAPDAHLEGGPVPSALLDDAGYNVVIDIAPRPSAARSGGRPQAPVIALWAEDEDEDVAFSRALGALYVAGANIRWASVWTGRSSLRVDLAAYPWQHERFLWRAPAAPAALETPAAPPPTAAREPVLETVIALLKEVIGSRASALDAHTPLATLGVDSMVATDFRGRLQRRLGVELPTLTLLRAETAADLARALEEDTPRDVEAMSDAEVEATLKALMTETAR